MNVIILHEHYRAGRIPTLAQHEVHPGFEKGSRENYLYFTLPPCLNFQRSSPAMWAAALATYQDEETKYLFLPEEVMKHSREDVQRDLVKHKLALQRNKHTDIWIVISKTFHEQYGGNPVNLLRENEFDVNKILQVLQKEKKKDFPFLCGYKMANYWLYILSQYTDVKFSNMNAISIIPDTHVLQSTVKLGMHTGVGLTPLMAEIVWKELLEGATLSPVEMHPVLWNWSRNNFLPEV